MPKRNTKRQVIRNTEALRDISDRENPVFKRISKSALVPAASSVRRAICIEDAPAGNIILVDFFDGQGVEITTGEDGVDFNIPIYCNISGGTGDGDLDEALPRLETDNLMFVTTSTFDNSGTPETRYYCISNFQASEECVCS